MNKMPHWRKIPRSEYYKAEAYLKSREKYCVAASARFITMKNSHGHVWFLPEHSEAGRAPVGEVSPAGEISALLLHNRRTLFPVFNKNHTISSPHFLNRFLIKIPIHAVQGLKEDTEILENLMENEGYYAAERIDYDLMNIDTPPRREAHNSFPAGLVLRKPAAGDTESIFALQAAYEKEEVMPKNAVFDPAVSRLNLQHILSSEHILLAELDGQIVGKINTSAESFTRFQIGGVYVRPDCRGRGIAAKMTAVFIESLLSLGKGVTLYVKQRNKAARTVYRRVGLSALADYRISYY